jgi:hypothetical protein
MSQEQAHAWAAEYLRGTASSETVAHFSRALAGDADLRRWFLEYMNVDGALAANLESKASPLAEFDRALRPGRFARLSRLAAVIVCALSPLVLLSWLVWHQHAALLQPDRARAAVAARARRGGRVEALERRREPDEARPLRRQSHQGRRRRRAWRQRQQRACGVQRRGAREAAEASLARSRRRGRGR